MTAPTRVFTVSELTFAIKSILEPHFRAFSVKGEISNFKLQSSGHLYFSLKDQGSQISAVLFKGNAASLSRLPKEGDQVVAKGELSLYAPRGQYQMVVREVQFLGVGELLLKLHLLKEELEKRGWFSKERKRPLPKLPRRIGVVTSPTGAAIQDILNVLTRRFAGIEVLLNPVKVQGEGAAQEIAQAIYEMNRYELVDLLIVGRGGGSIEDLWAFNEEVVVKAIYDSKIPVISAVGHETDFTLADWVADVRAPTPSAAAEMAIHEKAHLLQGLQRIEEGCRRSLLQRVGHFRERLAALSRHPLLSSPYALLSEPIQRLDAMRGDLEGSVQRVLREKGMLREGMQRRLELVRPTTQIAQFQRQLASYGPRLAQGVIEGLRKGKERLQRLEGHLQSLHPHNVLKKGYTILFSEKENSIILSAKEIEKNQPIVALFHDGKAIGTLNPLKSHDPHSSRDPLLRESV